MTTSSDSTFEFDLSKIVRLALRKAGLMNEMEPTSGSRWRARLADGLDFLETITKELQTLGAMQRLVDRYDVTAVQGQAAYTLDATTLDFVGVGMFLATGQTTGETAMHPIDRDLYQRKSNKDAQGRPTEYFLDRQAVYTLYVYPVPSSGGRMRFQRHRLIANSRNASNTADLERHWTRYLITALAAELGSANNIPMTKVQAFQMEAAGYKAAAEGLSKQRNPMQMHVVHRTRFRR